MKNAWTVRKKAGAGKNAGIDPMRRAFPRRMSTIPKYIGLREMRIGPVVTRAEGVSSGQKVVPFRTKARPAHRKTQRPAAIGESPS